MERLDILPLTPEKVGFFIYVKMDDSTSWCIVTRINSNVYIFLCRSSIFDGTVFRGFNLGHDLNFSLNYAFLKIRMH